MQNVKNDKCYFLGRIKEITKFVTMTPQGLEMYLTYL